MIKIVQPFTVTATDTKKIREVPRKVLAVDIADKDGAISAIVADDDGKLITLAPGKYRVKG